MLRRNTTKVFTRTSLNQSTLRPRIVTCRPYSVLNKFLSERTRSIFRREPWVIPVLVVGVATSGSLMYLLYKALTLFPPEIRGDLREAIGAKHEGDLVKSEQYFHRAWNTIQTLPLETLGSEPYLKLTGVAVAFAEVLEMSNKYERAYEVYTHALECLQQTEVKETLTGPERLRGVAISSKLGELAKRLKRPRAEEQKWLVWAVEELLRIVKDPSNDDVDYHHPGSQNLPMVPLPPWMTKTDIGAPLEALGSFYAEEGRLDYAMPLYLQAVSLLIPPAPKKTSPEDRCRGAQLMGNLSELIMRNPPTPEILHQAEAWASQALANTKKARQETRKPIEKCEEVYAAALFNLATFRDMAGDKKVARELYRDGLEQARSIGMSEGIVEASRALSRLDIEK